MKLGNHDWKMVMAGGVIAASIPYAITTEGCGVGFKVPATITQTEKHRLLTSINTPISSKIDMDFDTRKRTSGKVSCKNLGE